MADQFYSLSIHVCNYYNELIAKAITGTDRHILIAEKINMKIKLAREENK